MIGLLIVFAISWFLLWIIARKHISVLGFRITGERLKLFGAGALIMALFCAINLLGQAQLKGFNYVLNPDYGLMDAVNGTFWILKAAMLEELVFRGALLYLLIRWLGATWACIISATAFGMYHWHSYEVFGERFILMAYVFLVTGAAGWMFAYAFAKTKSIYPPLGLHFGWIITSGVVLSEGPLGAQLFIPDGEAIEMGGWGTLTFFLWQTVVVPGIISWIIYRLYKDKVESTAEVEPFANH